MFDRSKPLPTGGYLEQVSLRAFPYIAVILNLAWSEWSELWPFCGDKFSTEKRWEHGFYIYYFYGSLTRESMEKSPSNGRRQGLTVCNQHFRLMVLRGWLSIVR